MRSSYLAAGFTALLLTPAVLAQGDLCTSAVTVTPGTYVADGPATGAGFDGACFGAGSATNADWYHYTPAANGTIDVWSCDGGQDTRLSVMGGACGTLTCLGSNDDGCQMGPGLSFFASQVFGVPVLAGQDYYIQWDDYWVPNSFTWNLVYHCANAPSATQSVVPDCANNVFYIEVTITGMGSAATVDITNDGGAPPVAGVGLGTYTIGPFTLGSEVQYVLVNNTDPGCDLYSVDITNFPCPILSCGPDSYTYCYANGEDTYLVYQGTSTYSLALQFTSGLIETFGDQITVYDGMDAFSPILYTGNNFGDLSGLMFVSTNPDHALTLQITSDGFGSCADGFVVGSWSYTVGCLDCTPPAATYDVVLDCDSNQFFVEVDLTSLGTDPALDITNNGGAPTIVATSPGAYLSGPYPDGTLVTITLVNDANSLCNMGSEVLYNFPCPVVDCGPASYTYCYGNNDSTAFVYQSATTYPIAMIFNAGSLYPWDTDEIIVYDGLNNLAPVMYQGDNLGNPLDGMLFTSTNPDRALTLRVRSDAFTSCSDFGLTPFNYTVSCLDCTNPGGTFSVVPDCVHNGFFIQMDLDSTGSAPVVDVINTFNTDTVFGLGPGVHDIGPFPLDSLVQITVLNGDNPLCRISSPAFSSPSDSCIIVSCGFDNYDYCYTNDDDAWFVYQADSPAPLTISFFQGDLLANDKIVVYNGLDDYAALLYNGNNGGDLTGFAISSSNIENALTLHVISDSSGSCSSGEAPLEMQWFIACGSVGIGETAPSGLGVHPNPTNGWVNLELAGGSTGTWRLQLMDLAGRLVMDEVLALYAGRAAIDLSMLPEGSYALRLVGAEQLETVRVQVAR